MDHYNQRPTEEIHEAVIRSIESSSGKEVFTLRIIDSNDIGLDAVIVFWDKSILTAIIQIEEINGSLAARVRGNYL